MPAPKQTLTLRFTSPPTDYAVNIVKLQVAWRIHSVM
jgi:hypothetical protein